MEKSKLFLSSNILKIIACFFMCIDHIGVAIINYFNEGSVAFQIGFYFRYAGRLALPIFTFLIIQGLVHSKSIIKYLMRMSIATLFISICLICIVYTTPILKDIDGNIFLTFALSIAFIYLLNRKDNKKYLAALPLLYILGTFIISVIETNNGVSYAIYFPIYLRPEYHLLGFCLITGGYYVLRYYENSIKNTCANNNIDYDSYIQNDSYKVKYNSIYSLYVVAIDIIFTLLKYINVNLDVLNFKVQSYMVIGIIFIIFYSHKPGFKNKYTQFAFYAFYPLHLAIIFGIFMLIFNK
jgi:NADH:ubiquinone oxidoreductase subunit K